MSSPALLSPDEIYRIADRAMISALGEDRRVERKPAGFTPRALGDYFSVWANTAPDGGLILVGVEDDGSIPTGLSKLPQKRLNELEQTGITFCPDARHETRRLEVVNDAGQPDFILLIRVHYNHAKVVETVEGTVYTRVGDSKKKLSRDEVHELQIDKKQVDLEQEPSKLSYPDEFDTEAIREFAATVIGANKLTPRTDEEILIYRRLGKRIGGKFVPNVACALVFARDPITEFPGCKIRFLRFDGEWERTGADYNAVKDILVEGNIPTLIVATERLLDSQLREFSALGPDSKFYTTPEYPKEAWYEAIVNACVHRSYGLRNMNIFVKMFDDRLVIESPGGFPPFVTPENIYESHHPRNPHMMDALQFLRFVKAANEGTRRMRDMMARERLPSPEFVQKDTGHTLVRVTLRNDIKQRRVWVDADVSLIIGESKAKSLSQDEHRAVNFVAENKSINVSQFQRLTGRNWPSARRILLGLVKAEIFSHIHKEGKDRDPGAHFVLYNNQSNGTQNTRETIADAD